MTSNKEKPQGQAGARALLVNGAQQLGIELEEQQIARLLRYCEELHKWNRRMNLIAKYTSVGESIDKHFIDSLTLLPVLNRRATGSPTLLDVGTGAGFPGLVLKAARPELKVTLVEPREKRSFFLKHIIRTLQLANVEVVTRRIEEPGALPPEQTFSFITSRALADPARFIPMVERFMGPDSAVILMLSGKDPDQPIPRGLSADFQLIEQTLFALPFSGSTRQIAVIGRR